MTEEKLVTEVPSSLKQLARLVVRGFYSIEDALIIDMLVRNPCMKEDDICELLKFERKMLRARIATLKNDKFIQVRLRMETGSDGKAQKVNYYFINYKTFVNVIKYKLDLMRKRLETEERDATSRASFKCPGCLKTFTDLEADQLFDFTTGEFHCTYCREVVEEDSSALPKKDSRLLLAKFNEQLDPLYILLREVEGIKLAPEVLEPEPVDISTIRGLDKRSNAPPPGQEWSGEATRRGGFAVEETRVDITIGEESNSTANRKEQPIWMTESTVITNMDSQESNKVSDSLGDIAEATAGGTNAKNDDIMSVLLAHEKRPTNTTLNAVKGLNNESESSSDEMNDVHDEMQDVETMDSDDDDNDDVPTVTVGNKTYPITEINDTIIAEMSQSEKEIYVQVFQDYYSHMNI
ncbi:general transcription factor IIE subunit 1 [Diabrotica virgifera virgifera]|uniref:HTH TFE/IIEalpha-type domain-containing protein n=1 Tax=Diabrotica virgifera virgifera TaxID=50390 RepID=A0ABM5I926_DIAVI|nr:general transcription factor IIE subunit 1 [Diabrotica virgifera virgifera]